MSYSVYKNESFNIAFSMFSLGVSSMLNSQGLLLH